MRRTLLRELLQQLTIMQVEKAPQYASANWKIREASSVVESKAKEPGKSVF